MTTVPTEVLDAYGWQSVPVAPLAGGLINETYLVGPEATPHAVLQKLHPVFATEVNLDIEAITARLAERGLETPRLIRTAAGELWVDRWRALSFVRGHSFDSVQSPAQAHSAGALIGRFHSALDGFEHDFHFVRPGAHDTKRYLQALADRRASGSSPHPDALELTDEILEAALALPPLPSQPKRITHGDLKISNVRFRPESEAVCLLDLDTLGWQTLSYELGDAMRSWCNDAREDEPPRFDEAIFAAAINGYRSTMPASVTVAELEWVASGVQVVSLELAARFCADIYDDSYFGWDAKRFSSRQAHNAARAAAMLELSTLVASRFRELVRAAQGT